MRHGLVSAAAIAAVAAVTLGFGLVAASRADQAPFTITIDSAPTTETTGTATVTFSTGGTPATFECALTGAESRGPEPCTSPWSRSGLPNGDYTLLITGTPDRASGLSPDQARTTWTEAVGPPETTIDGGPADGATVPYGTATSFWFKSDHPTATFRCELAPALDFTRCKPGIEYRRLAPGVHELSVQATDDPYGKDLTPAHRTWTVSSQRGVAPTLTITRVVGLPTTTKLFFVSDQTPVTFWCSIDRGAFTQCEPGVTYATPRLPNSVRIYTFHVYATNAAGAQSPIRGRGRERKPPGKRSPSPDFVAVSATTGGHNSDTVVWIAVLGILVVVAVGATLALRARAGRALRVQWQLEAQEEEPSGSCKKGGYTWRRDCTIEPVPRTIDRLRLSSHTEQGSTLGHTVDGEVVDALNSALASTRLGREPEPLAPTAARLVAEIDRWIATAEASGPVKVEAHLKGGKLECEFTRYECENGHWVKRRTWKAEVEDEADEPVSTVESIPTEDATARLEHDLRDFVERA